MLLSFGKICYYPIDELFIFKFRLQFSSLFCFYSKPCQRPSLNLGNSYKLDYFFNGWCKIITQLQQLWTCRITTSKAVLFICWTAFDQGTQNYVYQLHGPEACLMLTQAKSSYSCKRVACFQIYVMVYSWRFYSHQEVDFYITIF